MLELIRKRCKELMEINPEKYSLIESILTEDNCFMEMSADTAVSILLDLNYPLEEAKKIYLNLIKKKNL